MKERYNFLNSLLEEMEKKWSKGLNKILKERNPELYQKIKSMEEEINEALKLYRKGEKSEEELKEMISRWKKILKAAFLHQNNNLP